VRIGTALLAAVLAFAALTPAAHAVTASFTLDAAASVAHVFTAHCFDDGRGAPASLVAQVSDDLPDVGVFVSVQVYQGSTATSSTDAIDGDGTPSPLVAIDGGAGDYAVLVAKSGAGAEDYSLTLECRTGAAGGGVATGTDVDGFPPPPSVPAAGAIARALAAGGLALAAARRLRSRFPRSPGGSPR